MKKQRQCILKSSNKQDSSFKERERRKDIVRLLALQKQKLLILVMFCFVLYLRGREFSNRENDYREAAFPCPCRTHTEEVKQKGTGQLALRGAYRLMQNKTKFTGSEPVVGQHRTEEIRWGQLLVFQHHPVLMGTAASEEMLIWM